MISLITTSSQSSCMYYCSATVNDPTSVCINLPKCTSHTPRSLTHTNCHRNMVKTSVSSVPRFYPLKFFFLHRARDLFEYMGGLRVSASSNLILLSHHNQHNNFTSLLCQQMCAYGFFRRAQLAKHASMRSLQSKHIAVYSHARANTRTHTHTSALVHHNTSQYPGTACTRTGFQVLLLANYTYAREPGKAGKDYASLSAMFRAKPALRTKAPYKVPK